MPKSPVVSGFLLYRSLFSGKIPRHSVLSISGASERNRPCSWQTLKCSWSGSDRWLRSRRLPSSSGTVPGASRSCRRFLCRRTCRRIPSPRSRRSSFGNNPSARPGLTSDPHEDSISDFEITTPPLLPPRFSS